MKNVRKFMKLRQNKERKNGERGREGESNTSQKVYRLEMSLIYCNIIQLEHHCCHKLSSFMFWWHISVSCSPRSTPLPACRRLFSWLDFALFSHIFWEMFHVRWEIWLWKYWFIVCRKHRYFCQMSTTLQVIIYNYYNFLWLIKTL